MPDTDALTISLKTKKRKKIVSPDSISIIKFYILINKIKKLRLQLLSTTSPLQKI